MDWVWAATEEAGLPIGLACAAFLPVVGQVAERHPGLKLHVDHMGRGGGATDAAAWETLPQLIDLAQYPNVAVKVSGAPSYSSEPYPFANIHDYIHQIYDAFGPDRLFLGHRHHPYALHLARVRDHVHRRTVLADRRRQRVDHGQSPMQLDRLGTAGALAGALD